MRAAIAELSYRPHLAAQQLRTRRSQLLGLRIHQAPEPTVFDRFLHAMTEAAAAADYRVILYTAGDDEREIDSYDELLDRWNVDGLVLTYAHSGDRRTRHLGAPAVPFVTFGRPWDGANGHSWVDVDGAAGTRAATRHLLDSGHRRIGFVGWPEDSDVGNDRLSGWAGTVSAAGLSVPEPRRCLNDIDAGRAADLTLDAYRNLASRDFPLWFMNSVIVTFFVTIGRVFFDSLAGYALARLHFAGRSAMSALFIALLAVPGVVLLIPKYLVLVQLGIFNTYFGMIIPLIADAAGVFIMRQWLHELPHFIVSRQSPDLNTWTSGVATWSAVNSGPGRNSR